MLSDREISAVVDRLWTLSAGSAVNDVLATDAIVYDSVSGALTVGAAALEALPPCLAVLRGMRLSERHRLAGVDGEACVFVGTAEGDGTPFDGAAGLLLVRDGRISRCEMWLRPRRSGAAAQPAIRKGA